MTAIKLKYPVTVGDHTVSSVTFHRAKVKDVEAIQAAHETDGEFTASIVTIARLTGLSPDEVREIDAEDMITLAKAIPDFLPRAVTSDIGDQSSLMSPAS